jgi:uncharacterized surface protein with fasciclin (FAS1) repeats
MKKLLITSLTLIALIALAGCSETGDSLTAPAGQEKDRGGNAPAKTTIVDVALAVNANTGEFSTLIAAVVTAGLVDALSAKGQLTVFAPTDAAFAELGLNADNIGDVPLEALTNILLYHVAKGRRMAADVIGSDQIRMLNGEFTMISLNEGMAYIDDSQIIATDVPADNGVIHVIDTVLQP